MSENTAPPFEFGTVDNFAIEWNGATYAVTDGQRIVGPSDPEWIDAQILILSTLLERLARYRDLLAAELPKAEAEPT